MQTTISTSTRLPENVLLKKILLTCGILSSVLYIAMNIFIPMQFEGYSYVDQTVSELSALDAPTRAVWVPLGLVYAILFSAFGFGVQLTGDNRQLRILGGLIIAYSVINMYWPPMHLRGVETSLTDLLHLVWAGMAIVFMMLIMGFGAAALGRRFRNYTILTTITYLIFGSLMGIEGPDIPKNLPTPWLGVWERIMIAAFMVWVIVLAVTLLRRQNALLLK